MKGRQLNHNLKKSIWVCIGIALILSALKIAFGLPRPFVIFLGSILVGSSAFVLWMDRRAHVHPFVLSGKLTAAWLVTNAILLGMVYQIDRSRWIWFNMTGYNITLTEDFTEEPLLSPERFVINNRIFIKDPKHTGGLILPKGYYEFDRTVVIPRGASLTIEPGAVLKFAAGRSLVCYGPLIARGIDEEITFGAKTKWLKWGVVAIIDSDQESIIENVQFENARQARINGTNLPGGLSIVNSKARILNSRFLDMYGKDAVYVDHGSVVVEKNLIKNAFKDGLDFDGGTGLITDNLFMSCGDEGIDLSENHNIRVHDNRILDKKGGRISADFNLESIRSLNTLGVIGTSDKQNNSL